jgi:hypothetical protein
MNSINQVPPQRIGFPLSAFQPCSTNKGFKFGGSHSNFKTSFDLNDCLNTFLGQVKQ